MGGLACPWRPLTALLPGQQNRQTRQGGTAGWYCTPPMAPTLSYSRPRHLTRHRGCPLCSSSRMATTRSTCSTGVQDCSCCSDRPAAQGCMSAGAGAAKAASWAQSCRQAQAAGREALAESCINSGPRCKCYQGAGQPWRQGAAIAGHAPEQCAAQEPRAARPKPGTGACPTCSHCCCTFGSTLGASRVSRMKRCSRSPAARATARSVTHRHRLQATRSGGWLVLAAVGLTQSASRLGRRHAAGQHRQIGWHESTQRDGGKSTTPHIQHPSPSHL